MELFRTQRFKKDFKRFPVAIQERVGKSLERPMPDTRHPSLHMKKMEGAPDIWELRFSDNYRSTFQFVQEGVLLRLVGTHNVLRQP